MPRDLRRTGHPRAGPLRQRALEVKDLHPIGTKRCVDFLHVFHRQLIERDSVFLREPHHRTDSVMSVAEGHALEHEVVGQIGREQSGIGHSRSATLAVKRHAPQCASEHVGAHRGLVEAVEYRRLVLLEIAIVSERQPLRQRKQRVQVALQARRLTAEQFARIRIFLLRHQ